MTFKIIFCSLIFGASISQAASGGGGINIPVRLAITAGYHSFSNNFGQDLKDDSLAGPAFGADFNVPFKSAHMLLGVTGWLTLPVKSGNSTYTGSLVAGPYLGYMAEKYDLFVGPAIGSTSYTAEDTVAAPNYKINLSASSMACGFGGTRYYFGKGITFGLGLTGYYCQGGSYKKTVTSMSKVDTETKPSEKATSAGGFLYIFIGWNDERALL